MSPLRNAGSNVLCCRLFLLRGFRSRSLKRGLALGAAGVYVGTRFVVSEESAAHPIYKEQLLQSDEFDTIHSHLFDVGWPDAGLRTLWNSTVAMWEAAGRPPSGQRPGEGDAVATRHNGRPFVRYSSGTAVGRAGRRPCDMYPAGRRDREGNRAGS